MEEKITRTVLWNKAGIAGLVLGLVSTAYLFITQYVAELDSSVLVTILNFVLWAAKFAGCIYLMRFFMKRLVAGFSEADNKDTFRFGVIVALCSALIYAAASLANVLVLNPDMIAEQMATAMQTYSGMLDSNSMSMLEKIEESMPQIIFFSNLIYCFLFGVVLSAILSRNIPSRNPFADLKAEEDDDE